MEGWELLPNGQVAVAMFTSWEIAIAPPSAGAIRLQFFRDMEAMQQGRQEVLQLGMTRDQLNDLGTALLDLVRDLDGGITPAPTLPAAN